MHMTSISLCDRHENVIKTKQFKGNLDIINLFSIKMCDFVTIINSYEKFQEKNLDPNFSAIKHDNYSEFIKINTQLFDYLQRV